ncbi:MAG: indole-3-glycerol phosphate synthase TrpC [Acetatifactor sp.]
METILQTIADYALVRVAKDKEKVPAEALKERCKSMERSGGQSFLDALRKPGVSFICEVKKASPSKGVIAEEFPYVEIAEEYAAAGADCISCLTEPKWFLGSDEIFGEIRSAVTVPMLRKDFVVDEYQLYQAKVMGADAVLLICALLNRDTVARYLDICRELGLAALVETHDEKEIKDAVLAGAEIIGVNNRNLKDFSVDINNSSRLRALVPEKVLFVAESGIRSPEDVTALRRQGVDGVLVGETLMRAQDKKTVLRRLRGEEG